MSNFEDDIKRINDEISKDGSLDNIIREKLIKAYEDAITESFKWGKLRDAIMKRIESVMLPAIENCDLSKYIIKLDDMLSDIVKTTALPEYKQLLSNFGTIMSTDKPTTITLKDILKQYMKFCGKNIDCSGREVNFESGPKPQYMDGEAIVSLETDENRYWRGKDDSYVLLRCNIGEDEDDENQKNLERSFYLVRYGWEKEDGYALCCHFGTNIQGLRYADPFDVWLMALSQAGTRLIAQPGDEESDSFTPDDTPEASWS